jgi:hypothetical protein
MGLAGGLNLYGVAGGDPVDFGDTFGLSPENVGGDGKTKTEADCPEGSVGRNHYRSGAIVGDQISPLDFVGPGEIKVAIGFIAGAKHALSSRSMEITEEYSDGARRRVYRGAIKEINFHKKILKKASPEQVNSS